MIVLKACELVRQFDAAPILNRVSFEVRKGEKIGLVGPNGAGKSTLFHLLAKKDTADSGWVEVGSGSRIDLLEQDPEFDPDRTLVEEVQQGLGPLIELQQEAERIAYDLATVQEPVAHARLQKRYDAIQLDLHRLDAYTLDHRVEEVLHGLGFVDAQKSQKLGELSGGQRNRAALARLLLSNPDLLLLDEPTNHLDIEATEWLEKYLAASEQAVIVVSHDRYFLDRVTQRILELYQGQVVDFPGSFSQYWRLKDERNKVLAKTFEKQQEFIAKTEDFIRRNHYGQKATQAKDREKKLDRLELVDRPREIPSPLMKFGSPRRTGDWVIDAQGLTKGFGTPLFENVTLQIPRGARVGIFGPNGAGKTTLLRTMLGELQPDAGTVRFGTNVDLAYYDQQLDSVNPDVDLIEAIRPANNPNMTPGQLRDVLARFGLKGEIVNQRVASLSGGERSKTALAKVAALNANLLILDEPTNHLDLWACASLEQSLCEFEGTLLFVSHDRYFLDHVATALIVFEPGRWRWFDGNYTAYLDSMQRVKDELQQESRLYGKPNNSGDAGFNRSADGSKSAGASAGTVKRKRRFPFRKVEDLERDIASQEEQVASLLDQLGNPDILRDGLRAKQVQQDYESAQQELARLIEHWEEAMELNG